MILSILFFIYFVDVIQSKDPHFNSSTPVTMARLVSPAAMQSESKTNSLFSPAELRSPWNNTYDPTGATSIGKQDLEPPLPYIAPYPGTVPAWNNPEAGGSMVGPNHPLFGGVGQLPYAPGFGSGFPRPRYDPLTPLAPRGPSGRDFGGRGRGRNAPRIPGEPNPDHLRPPTGDDDDSDDKYI